MKTSDKIVMVSFLINCLVVLSAYLLHGFEEEGLRLINRYLARWSFMQFTIVFLAAPLERLLGGVIPLVRYRSALGVAFAVTMLFHLVTIITLYRLLPELEMDMPTLLGGGLGFIMAFSMAISSAKSVRLAMGQKLWKVVHTFGLYWLWFIFAFTFVSRIEKTPEFVYLAGFSIAILFLKIGWKFTNR